MDLDASFRGAVLKEDSIGECIGLDQDKNRKERCGKRRNSLEAAANEPGLSIVIGLMGVEGSHKLNERKRMMGSWGAYGDLEVFISFQSWKIGEYCNPISFMWF